MRVSQVNKKCLRNFYPPNRAKIAHGGEKLRTGIYHLNFILHLFTPTGLVIQTFYFLLAFLPYRMRKSIMFNNMKQRHFADDSW